MLVQLLVLGGLVLVGLAVWKLKSANKAVTPASVLSGVSSEVKAAANTVSSDAKKL